MLCCAAGGGLLANWTMLWIERMNESPSLFLAIVCPFLSYSSGAVGTRLKSGGEVATGMVECLAFLSLLLSAFPVRRERGAVSQV